MTQIRRRFTGDQRLQSESRPDPGALWKPTPHLVALGYASPFTPDWELRHCIGYGGRPGATILPFQPLSVRHLNGPAPGAGYRVDRPLSLVPSLSPLRLPAGAQALGYAARLGFVLAKELSEATPEQASAAIGAFVLLCEFTARAGDRAADLGPVPTSVAGFAVPAGDLLGSWPGLLAAASVNGQVTGQARASASAIDLGAWLADASADERLLPGELFSIDTLAAASGGQPLASGDRLIIAVPRLGRIEHTVG